MTRVYYREAVGALVVFDMTRFSTFQAVLKWKGDLDAKVALCNGRPVPVVLLGNKCDQQRYGLCSKLPKLDTFSREQGFVGWYETSAKVNLMSLCMFCTSADHMCHLGPNPGVGLSLAWVRGRDHVPSRTNRVCGAA